MRAIIDTVSDLLIDLSARSTKVILMLTAIAFATGALTASIGIARMAERQIDTTLAATVTDRITVSLAVGDAPVSEEEATVNETGAGQAATEGVVRLFPAGAIERISAVDGVISVGLKIPVGEGVPATGASGAILPGAAIAGATSGYLEVLEVSAPSRWLLDQPADRAQTNLAIIGSDLAAALGIPANDTALIGYTVTILDVTYQVVDVIDHPEVQNAVLIPYARAVASLGADTSAIGHVRSEPGAARPVSRVLAESVRPADPDTLAVSHTADLTTLRTGVATELSRLVATIGALLIVLTALLIANNMIVSVTARTAEIGLRRSLGASRTAIASLFLTEAMVTGILGGAAGSALAAATITSTAVINGWEPVLAPWYLALGPAIGIAVAMAGTLHPAVRAARTPPAAAVRQD